MHMEVWSMDMREQLYMLAIDKYRGIKDAAQSLHISPPALSIFLGKLEEQNGVTFFDRIGKQFVPTQAGKIYLEHARKMILLETQYEEALKKYMGGSSGTIRFGIHPRRTLYLLARILPLFSSEYPDVTLIPYEESSDQMVEQLLTGELDFAIVNMTSNHPLLEYHPLYEDYLVAVVAEDHPVCLQMDQEFENSPCPCIDLKRFNGERFILQKPDQSSRHYTDLAIEHDHAQPGKRFILENLESASQLAAEGYGIAFNFYQYMRYFHYPKPVRCFRVGSPAMKTSYSIVTLKGKQAIAPMERLITLFHQFS